jgi:hypothetical protein
LTILSQVETNAAHIICLLEYGLWSQAETCRRTEQQMNNTMQEISIDSMWIRNECILPHCAPLPYRLPEETLCYFMG